MPQTSQKVSSGVPGVGVPCDVIENGFIALSSFESLYIHTSTAISLNLPVYTVTCMKLRVAVHVGLPHLIFVDICVHTHPCVSIFVLSLIHI